jgi:hypothetical protein
VSDTAWRAAATVAVACLLALAGCNAPVDGASDPATTVEYALSNGGPASLTVALFVVDGPLGGVEVRYENGTARRFPDADRLAALSPNATRGAAWLEPLGGRVAERTHRLPPGSGVGGSADGATRNASVLYVVGHPDGDGPLRAVGVSACRDAPVHRLTLGVDADGTVSAATTCADGSA